MVGFCHLTDSHHYHHGQKPTMVGICHGGNMPVGRHHNPDGSSSSWHRDNAGVPPQALLDDPQERSGVQLVWDARQKQGLHAR